MAYARREIASEKITEQMEICARLRAQLGEGERFAMVDTYGCQQNESDSEVLRGYLRAMGYAMTGDEEKAEIIVVNTCAVREHAQMRVFGNVGALTHIKREHPERIVVLCGCMAQSEEIREQVKRSYRMVDLCFGPHDLWRFPELMAETFRVHGMSGNKGRVFSAGSEEAVAENLPRARDGSVKAWLTIMNGCNNFCSYCIVPYVRGRERSRLPEDILAECRGLIAEGYKELTLLGQNVNSYGKDLGSGVDFADLIGKIAELPGEFTVRFMTSHPRDASHKLFDTMASHEKIAKQFHLPFQSGNDRILKEMNRHYDRARYLELIEYGRKLMPDIVFTSDVIVGFPGETEEEFEDTISLIEQVRYEALFTFIYSPRPGTPAAKLPDPTPKEEKNRRFDRLLAVQNAISEEKHRAYIGKTLRVLADGRDGALLTARTDGGRLVRFEGDDALIGQFIKVTVTDATTWSLVGTLAP